MFVFYDWPFPHVYFAKSVANIISLLNLASVFRDYVVFYGEGYHFHFVDSNRGSNNSLISIPSRHV